MAEHLEKKQTYRIETFSDSVFAFAITLLVLNLKDPILGIGEPLLQGLLANWPEFLALTISFVTILIMWINHHNMFNYIRKANTSLMILNGSILLFILLTPFTTAIVANYMLSPNSNVAAAIYAGGFLLTSISWNLFWQYVSKNRHLLADHVNDEHVKTIIHQYYIGPVLYASAIVVAYFSGIASIVMVFLVAVFYAISASTVKTF